MKYAHKILASVLAVLLVATIYGLVRTEDNGSAPGATAAAVPIAPGQAALVDQKPLLTAQALAHQPTSAAEMPFAQSALQLADQEMDLAFALAILDVTQHPPVLTAEAEELEARLQKAQDAWRRSKLRSHSSRPPRLRPPALKRMRWMTNLICPRPNWNCARTKSMTRSRI
jgi:hypothetical protein